MQSPLAMELNEETENNDMMDKDEDLDDEGFCVCTISMSYKKFCKNYVAIMGHLYLTF